jgi:hypothetical protein
MPHFQIWSSLGIRPLSRQMDPHRQELDGPGLCRQRLALVSSSSSVARALKLKTELG